jgi:hypothetical protein
MRTLRSPAIGRLSEWFRASVDPIPDRSPVSQRHVLLPDRGPTHTLGASHVTQAGDGREVGAVDPVSIWPPMLLIRASHFFFMILSSPYT